MIKKIISTALIFIMGTGLSGCGGTTTGDYDVYIFNTKGESAEAMEEAAKAYETERGKRVKVFSLGSGANTSDTLRAEMNSKNKPTIFSVTNVSDLTEWEEGGFVWDLNQADNAEFKELADSIPENMRLSSDGSNSYGIPYNVEGYGYIVDKKMIDALVGEDYSAAFLQDLKNCSYREFETVVKALDAYIKNDETASMVLRGNTYPLMEKSTKTNSLTGVFAMAGAEKWTYGDHLINIALSTVFENPGEAKTATDAEIEGLKPALIAYAKTLDLKTSYAAGENGPLERGSEFINTTTSGYDNSVQLFASGKAVFLKQGNWVYTNLQKANREIAEDLTFIPIKMPFEEKDIKTNISLEKLQRSIPVYVPNYYAVNAKATDEEKQAAMDFLVWLNTSDAGKKFITEDMAFIPYNADFETTTLNNSLGSSILEYMKSGDIISNPYSGAPVGFTADTFGLEIMEKYLTLKDWTEKEYNEIADFAVSKWKEMKGQLQ